MWSLLWDSFSDHLLIYIYYSTIQLWSKFRPFESQRNSKNENVCQVLERYLKTGHFFFRFFTAYKNQTISEPTYWQSFQNRTGSVLESLLCTNFHQFGAVGAQILNAFQFRMVECILFMVPTIQKLNLAGLDCFVWKEKMYFFKPV